MQVVIGFSHLMGMFYRTIRMLENGIKPVYVFDGKPPEMKSGEVHVHFHKIHFAKIDAAAAIEELI